MLKEEEVPARFGVLATFIAVAVLSAPTPGAALTYFQNLFGSSTVGTYLDNCCAAADTTRHAAFGDYIGSSDSLSNYHSYAGSKFNQWDGHLNNVDVVSGRLKITYRDNTQYGFPMSYYLRGAEFLSAATVHMDAYRAQGTEISEAYISYNVEFASDFNDAADAVGGKLPGVAGTRTKGGAGKPSTGSDGWSARLGWFQATGGGLDNDSLAIHGYIYHTNMAGTWGHNLPSITNSPNIAKGDAHFIQAYVKLNTVNQADGIFKLWIDSELRIHVDGDSIWVYNESGIETLAADLGSNDLQYSDSSSIQINRLWADFFHGGYEEDVRNDSELYIDNLRLTNVALKPASGEFESGMPSSLALEQNSPNPFNPETSISYSLDRPETVSLVVYNSMGQVVRRLVDRELAPGTYSATWDGKDDRGRVAASGVYLYRLDVGGISQTKKMVLAR